MQELLVWELSGHSSFKGIIEERERIGHKLQEELNKFWIGAAITICLSP